MGKMRDMLYAQHFKCLVVFLSLDDITVLIIIFPHGWKVGTACLDLSRTNGV